MDKRKERKLTFSHLDSGQVLIVDKYNNRCQTDYLRVRTYLESDIDLYFTADSEIVTEFDSYIADCVIMVY